MFVRITPVSLPISRFAIDVFFDIFVFHSNNNRRRTKIAKKTQSGKIVISKCFFFNICRKVIRSVFDFFFK